MRALLGLTPLLLTACTSAPLVTVSSVPPGASIHDQGGDYLGTTDTTITVAHGHELRMVLQLDGYREKLVDLGKVVNDRSVIVTLERQETRLYVTTLPAGAQLGIFRQDGSEITFEDTGTVRGEGQFTDRWYTVPDDVGTVKLVLALDGHKRLEKWVKVMPRRDNKYTFTLERHTPSYTIESDPPGAEVFERSLGFLGRTPLEKTFAWSEIVKLSRANDPSKLTKVVLHLTVKKDGYQTQEAVKTLPLQATGAQRLSLSLKAEK